MLKKIKVGWPQAVIASVAIIAFATVYVLAPEDRDTIEKAVLGAWAFVSTFLGPLVARHAQGVNEETS